MYTKILKGGYKYFLNTDLDNDLAPVHGDIATHGVVMCGLDVELSGGRYSHAGVGAPSRVGQLKYTSLTTTGGN